MYSSDSGEKRHIWLWVNNRYQNGTLVSGNMDQNLRNPSWLIVSHAHLVTQLNQLQHRLPLLKSQFIGGRATTETVTFRCPQHLNAGALQEASCKHGLTFPERHGTETCGRAKRKSCSVCLIKPTYITRTIPGLEAYLLAPSKYPYVEKHNQYIYIYMYVCIRYI